MATHAGGKQAINGESVHWLLENMNSDLAWIKHTLAGLTSNAVVLHQQHQLHREE